MSSRARIVSCTIVSVIACCAADAQIVIKLGTIAPEGSIWHDALLETRQQWREISNGEVELRIYASGVLGGEDEMVRKMQRRGLNALAISGSGLPLIDGVVSCLNLPMFFDSYDELDYVRDGIGLELEQSFEQSGYKLLSWAEAGWVHFFARTPVRTPADLRQLRLWIGTGDPKAEKTMTELGFRVVPLPATDMLTGLQTGLIEVIDVPPLFALLDRGYQAAPYMTALKFAPLNAATVITVAAWERLPASYRDRLLAAAGTSTAKLREEIQRTEQEAVEEMVTRGLTVVELDAQTVAEWRRESVAAYPRLDCALEHPELFAKILRLQRERAANDGAR